MGKRNGTLGKDQNARLCEAKHRNHENERLPATDSPAVSLPAQPAIQGSDVRYGLVATGREGDHPECSYFLRASYLVRNRAK